MNLELLLERAAKTPDKQLIYNNDPRLGESMECSFNEIKNLIHESDNELYTDENLVEMLCNNNFDLTESERRHHEKED